MLVELEQEVCSHCRTPRDDMEMEEGRALVRNEELRRKRRPKRIAAGVGAVALLGSIWLLRGVWTPPLIDSWNRFQAEVEKTRQPSHWLKGQPALTAAAPPVTIQPSRTAVPIAVSSFVYLNQSGAPPAPQATPAPAEPSSEAPPPPPPLGHSPPPPSRQLGPGEMRVQGFVYDLATSRPVGNTTVKFDAPAIHSEWTALTDSAGRYEVYLFKSHDHPVTVMIEAPGYRKGLLEDRDPPFRDRSQQSRKDFIAETVDSDLEAVPLRHRESERIVRLDLVLVPLAEKK